MADFIRVKGRVINFERITWVEYCSSDNDMPSTIHIYFVEPGCCILHGDDADLVWKYFLDASAEIVYVSEVEGYKKG